MTSIFNFIFKINGKDFLIKLGFLLILGIISMSLDVIMPKFFSSFIDNVLVANDRTLIEKYVFLLAIIVSFSIVSTFISKLLNAKIEFNVKIKTLLFILRQIQSVSPILIDKFDSSYLSKRVNLDCSTIVSFVLYTIYNFIIKTLYLLGAVFFICLIGVEWCLYLLVIATVYILIYKKLKKFLEVISRKLVENDNHFFSILHLNIKNNKRILIHDLSQFFENLLIESNSAYYQATKSSIKIKFFFTNSSLIISHFIMMMLFIIGGNQVIDSKLSVGNFLALSSYYTLSIGAISYFLSLGSEFVTAKVSYDRILEIIPDNKDISQASKLKLAEINEIEIKNLDFNYFDKNIFKNFSYIFKTNHIYGITGANGRGKSTLLQLLVGIYSADKGSILFNNIALSNLDLYYLRCNCISTMEQEPLIVPGKVSDNILLFKGQSCFLEEKINIWQEKLINKDLLYRNINSSLETTLSKGEIQKIAFLRTISKDSSLMIFDEPTASIDMETKQIMIKAIRECSKNKIVIVISHDEDVCKNLCTDLIKL